MKKFTVLTVPDEKLRQKAQPVNGVDAEIKTLLRDMLDIMYDSRGRGLAAPQIGILKRLVVMDVEPEGEEEHTPNPIKMVNPEILEFSDETSVHEEGCLSIPGVYADVKRPARVKVKYLDENGKEQILEADGLLSKCIQHEVDHLNGILYPDHLSRLKRDLLWRKYKKQQRESGHEESIL